MTFSVKNVIVNYDQVPVSTIKFTGVPHYEELRRDSINKHYAPSSEKSRYYIRSRKFKKSRYDHLWIIWMARFSSQCGLTSNLIRGVAIHCDSARPHHTYSSSARHHSPRMLHSVSSDHHHHNLLVISSSHRSSVFAETSL